MKKNLKPQILALLLSKQSHAKIAALLKCSKGTVSFHANAAYGKKRTAKHLKNKTTKKDRAVKLLGDCCAGCGEIKIREVYEFHHVDPKTKDNSLGDRGMDFSQTWKKILAELAKCVMLCANCHREVHAGVRVCPPLIPLVGVAGVEPATDTSGALIAKESCTIPITSEVGLQP